MKYAKDGLRRIMSDPRSMQMIMVGHEATWWLNDQLHTWLGEENAADTLSKSAPTTSHRRWASRCWTSRT
ncbi:hypothetical protein [Kibdelosporangium phytohabitans]|uniref:Uncharacterized protein n=1 Tax=Kibdelosporangium phytohabitans TaxID=860235 RepID=A0A0N7F565_9PSEU|nr:hypothetical protein [Kibdelosporangium phytohabitans]ALG13367.1 hypothetical protein AOZ06_46715 [Kibdelosporangium phytohabitans]MBE1465155.1 hypothetical protein [Kibdelosporangium phytohabitans]